MCYVAPEKRVECAKEEVAARRECAAVVPVIRGVVESFNGKVFNCRFEKALREALNGKFTGYVSAHKTEWRVTIEYQSHEHFRVNGYPWFCLASYRHGTEKGKPVHIDAAKLCADLRAHYETLLRDAAEIEEQAPRISELLRDIAHAESVLTAAKHAVNGALRDVYGIRL